jgi:hypothetical protein
MQKKTAQIQHQQQSNQTGHPAPTTFFQTSLKLTTALKFGHNITHQSEISGLQQQAAIKISVTPRSAANLERSGKFVRQQRLVSL